MALRYELLKEKNNELRERIDKAIEYIKQLQFAFDFEKDINKFAFNFLYTDEGKDLLNILKSDNFDIKKEKDKKIAKLKEKIELLNKEIEERNIIIREKNLTIGTLMERVKWN